MKLKFDAALDYQQEAIAAVRDVFQGQTPKQSLFTVAAITNEQMALGFGSESQQLTLGQGIGSRKESDRNVVCRWSCAQRWPGTWLGSNERFFVANREICKEVHPFWRLRRIV